MLAELITIFIRIVLYIPYLLIVSLGIQWMFNDIIAPWYDLRRMPYKIAFAIVIMAITLFK